MYEEVVDVIGEYGKVLPDHIRQLEYMERVIKEVLRLFPIAPIIARGVNADILIGEWRFHIVLFFCRSRVGSLKKLILYSFIQMQLNVDMHISEITEFKVRIEYIEN